jgi:hypothetical protein
VEARDLRLVPGRGDRLHRRSIEQDAYMEIGQPDHTTPRIPRPPLGWLLRSANDMSAARGHESPTLGEHIVSEVPPDGLQTEPGDTAESSADSLVRR